MEFTYEPRCHCGHFTFHPVGTIFFKASACDESASECAILISSYGEIEIIVQEKKHLYRIRYSETVCVYACDSCQMLSFARSSFHKGYIPLSFHGIKGVRCDSNLKTLKDFLKNY